MSLLLKSDTSHEELAEQQAETYTGTVTIDAAQKQSDHTSTANPQRSDF